MIPVFVGLFSFHDVAPNRDAAGVFRWSYLLSGKVILPRGDVSFTRLWVGLFIISWPCRYPCLLFSVR